MEDEQAFNERHGLRERDKQKIFKMRELDIHKIQKNNKNTERNIL
jgi:hypothetical protein